MAAATVKPASQTNKGDGSAFGTAGAGNTKGTMPTPPGRITTTAAQRAASNRKD